MPRAVVFGCAGTRLSPDERAFFADGDPLGFILFRRNCDSPGQVRDLVAALRDSVGRADAPVLIDQEGGRVARLRPPHWPSHPAARRIGELAERDADLGREAAWLNARLLADMLLGLGIDVDCAPVCDVPAPDGHDVIGDRAFGADPALVADLARASCEGFLAGGVLPVIKHIPGHGRARVDSHEELPLVEAPLDALEGVDFTPFRRLADLPLGMVAHVVYRTIDPTHAASVSARVIGEVVRGRLGFDGLLFSDDLSMQALSGSMGERARAVLNAGCDVVLHCNGAMAEMEDVALATPALTEASAARWRRARAWLKPVPTIDAAALRSRLDELLGHPAPMA
ncbi:MAG TPA: beta-N-acetylhexosaminidase [Azospirillaceae bacterium]|nr:beta-N-acetylhexosaminidase [Azospirillaceae bacterium]